MLVYKYRNCAQLTWETLLNRKLFFSSPEQLNDPLDSSIDIDTEYERAKKLIEESDNHPEKRKSFLIFLLNGCHQFRDPKTGENIALNKAVQLFIQSLGILSLSLTPTDPLLWSHYANGHRGICLGFENDKLNLGKIFLKDRVLYKPTPPYVDIFLKMTEDLGEFVKPWENHKYPAEQGDKFYTHQLSLLMRANLLVKSEKWKYEEEYRIVKSKPGAVSFKPNALVEVICGTKMPASDQETLSNILRHPEYSHVKVRHVRQVAGTFEFGLVDHLNS